MRIALVIALFIGGTLSFSCAEKEKHTETNTTSKEVNVSMQEKGQFELDGVYFDNRFAGARMNGVEKKNDSTFQIHILPENEPINKSPWYAFKIYSAISQEVYIELSYENFKHRYVPKLSTDAKSWVVYDLPITLSTSATLKINASQDTTWVASQEVISSLGMTSWMDMMVSETGFLKKEVAGKTVLNREIYALSSEQGSANKSIVLIARQHPPEVPGGTIAFKAFFGELHSNTALANAFRDKFNIYTFPLLNPDGADLGHWRHNANGVDLNRDWIDFNQPETQTVRNYIKDKVEDNGKTISFGIDFHTSYSGPYLLILDSLNEVNAATRIIPNWTKRISNDALRMEYRRRDQKLPYCYNWFYNEFGAEAVTYEDGDEIDREVIRARAKHYAVRLMEAMIDNLNQPIL